MPGSPDVAEFPRGAWLASTRRALTAAPTEALRMGDPRGRIELREALAEYLGRVRGVRTSPDSIVDLRGHPPRRRDPRPGVRRAPARSPSRPTGCSCSAMRSPRMGVPTTPIGVDEHGAVVDDLDRTDAAAALLTPAHHFPHGVPLHPTRRTAVLDWAQRTGGYLLEDDYDGEFRYDRQPVGAVQGLDPDRVVYLGLGEQEPVPVLRLGWMVLPDDLIDPVIAAMGGQQFYVNGIAQLTMADFIASGSYDKHIRRMRMSYRRRRDRLVAGAAAVRRRHQRAVGRAAPAADPARRHRSRGAAARRRGGHRAVRAGAAPASATRARDRRPATASSSTSAPRPSMPSAAAVDALCGVLEASRAR